MKNYTLYFSLFGKKMKTKILAESQAEAELKLRSKISIEKVEAHELPSDPFGIDMDLLHGIFGKKQ